MKVATLEDLPEIVEMGMNFAVTTGYVDYIDEDSVRNTFSNFITGDPTKTIIIFESGVGFLAGAATPFLFGKQYLASEIAWWIEIDARGNGAGKKFLEAFEYWAKEKAGCNLVSMACLDDNLMKFYDKQGYKLYERAYMKEL